MTVPRNGIKTADPYDAARGWWIFKATQHATYMYNIYDNMSDVLVTIRAMLKKY